MTTFPKITITRDGKEIELTAEEARSITVKVQGYEEFSTAEEVVREELNDGGFIPLPDDVVENMARNYVENYYENRMDHEYAIASAIYDAMKDEGFALPEDWYEANSEYCV